MAAHWFEDQLEEGRVTQDKHSEQLCYLRSVTRTSKIINESFTYLGATVTTTGGAAEDINRRIGKARQAYYKLRKIWSSGILRRMTMMKIFQAIILSRLGK